MRKLALALPVLNQHDLANETIESFKKNAYSSILTLIYDNGSDAPFKNGDYVIRSSKNVGVPKAMNALLDLNQKHGIAEYLVFTHTDVVMYQEWWDELVKEAIDDETGVLGFYGAMGIGSPDIYKTDYQMNQLARQAPVAGSRCELDQKVHGYRKFEENNINVAVLDGFTLIVRKDMRFEESFGLHHMYDNDICMQALNAGLKVKCVNVRVDHLGGRTDVNEDWVKGTGKSKQDVHSEAHPPFYEKWRPGNNKITLPYYV